jgi:hypothetical protein
MPRRKISQPDSGRDDADARGEHVYGTPPAGRGEGPVASGATRSRKDYAAGADGAQHVHAGKGSAPAPNEPVPPSPVRRGRFQPPIEPEK